jgi:hypothetical protein
LRERGLKRGRFEERGSLERERFEEREGLPLAGKWERVKAIRVNAM